MQQLNEMPKEGQFVVVWEYHSKIWCDTLKWVDGELNRYVCELNEFIPEDQDPWENNRVFLVL
jgi:hypothetical protein